MNKRFSSGPLVALALLCLSGVCAAEQAEFFPLRWDGEKGVVTMQVPAQADAIYVEALAGGLGSNDIGLDRGQLGSTRYVRFQRAGNTVLMVEPNQQHRAYSDNPAELRAVADSFAVSVLAAFTLVEDQEDTWVIDITDFVKQDAHGVSQRLQQRGQGSFSLDAARTVVLPDSVKNFPQNNVVEVLQTFSGSEPGEYVRQVTPSPQSITLRLRHMWIAPPDDGFAMRPYHPRSGGWALEYENYAAPLDASITERYLVRHRFNQEIAQREPIVYYVDSGVPEPIRSALVEGASWWSQAFAAAGYPNGFQVKVLPPDVDPLDVRYNVIQWVHRATRGWSYGWGVIDPRSGEIIKGHVSLGSRRVRQDMLIAEALTQPFDHEQANGDAARTMALQRIRQLSAHEVGHTLGIAHNFGASGDNDASVMDYPHPNLRLVDDEVDISRAYDDGIGEWDQYTVQYLYGDFGNQETAALAELRESHRHMTYISDADARVPDAAQPGAHLWDNGPDPVARLEELAQIRSHGIQALGAAAIRAQLPASALETRLVPIYLLPRFQIQAVAKLLGGVQYEYGLRDEQGNRQEVVEGKRQRDALKALLALINTRDLVIPEQLWSQLPPPPEGYGRDREAFTHQTGLIFDRNAPARALTQLVAQEILNPNRFNRVVQQVQADDKLPDGKHVLGAVSNWLEDQFDQPLGTAARSAAWVMLHEWMRLCVSDAISTDGGLLCLRMLASLQSHVGDDVGAKIGRFLENPSADGIPARAVVPPGSPI